MSIYHIRKPCNQASALQLPKISKLKKSTDHCTWPKPFPSPLGQRVKFPIVWSIKWPCERVKGCGRWVADCAVLSRPWRQIYDKINNLAAKESEPETRFLPIRIRIRANSLARNFMTQQKLSTAAKRQIAYKMTKSIKVKKRGGENVWPSYRYIILAEMQAMYVHT